ncbi:MAG: 16S rRNA (uracil(1498)-N(3))-methyltransferase [Alphaproteobacteria bacterium]
MTDHIYKYPRLFINAPLKENGHVLLEAYHAHYLKNVLRKGAGDSLRLFNGVDGEWLASVQELGKKRGLVTLEQKTREQSRDNVAVELWFSPIKKQNMDFLIEKAVELGVSAFRPVIMNRSENRKLNMDRIKTHIVEAAEQCERLDIPVLYSAEKLCDVLGKSDIPVHVCLERCDHAVPISVCDFGAGAAFLIGPEGGFDDSERIFIESCDHVRIISLGQRILRAETAAVSCLAYAHFSTLSK